TTMALAFVARRLRADTVAIVIATRHHIGHFDDLPALEIGGLPLDHARTLLGSVIAGHMDRSMEERFLSETSGNPLALLELPGALTRAEGGVSLLRAPSSLSDRLEETFGRRLDSLPQSTRKLLVLAAAEPLGDPLILHRAAERLGLPAQAADAA